MPYSMGPIKPYEKEVGGIGNRYKPATWRPGMPLDIEARTLETLTRIPLAGHSG